MNRFLLCSLVAFILAGCNDDSGSTPSDIGACIAQKFLPDTIDPAPHNPIAYKERYEISNTAPITSDAYSNIPSNYCDSESGYTGTESVLTVKTSGVLSLNYDSGNHTDRSFHKYTSSDPDFENDALVYDVKYEGSFANTGVKYHLTTTIAGGYVYSVHETKDDVSTIVNTFYDLSELEASRFSFLITSPGVLNSAELKRLYDDHLSF
jgi:hypothetical protein